MDGSSIVKACVVGTAAWETLFTAITASDRTARYNEASHYALLMEKPLLVVGQPRGRHPCGDVCIDLNGCPTCAVSVNANIEDLSNYDDKTFGAVFVSHVLEHVKNPDLAWAELNRVGEKVFMAYPYSCRVLARFVPDHKWLIKQTSEGYLFKAINGGEQLFLANDGTVLYL